MSNPTLPLQGLRILTVEQYGAGPAGTIYLADLGAEVIKIENLKEGGDFGRAVGPHFFGPGDSQFFQTFNRNKKSIALDLKQPEALAVFHDLVKTADGVLDNLRGDQPAKLGLTYGQLKAINPKIVCAHLSAYGRTGSRASWPGYDYLMQAEAGLMSLTGEPDAPPTKFGVSIIDLMTGLAASFALLAGVTSARATGMGRDIDTSLFDLALFNLNYPGTWYLNGGHVTGRVPRSGHPSLVPSELYKTRDGWLLVMCNKEKFWQVLADALGKPEWKTDPALATFKARLANRDQVRELLDATLSTNTTAHWIKKLGGDVPVSPVYDVQQALESDFVREREDVAEFHYPDGRAARMVVGPIRCPGVEPPKRAAPALGADTEALLAELGYSSERIATLRKRGAIG
jgi:crotonobetainyl-CoA:carnitine CoA-transferase CaiB-like acyl-CoA transferase